MTKVQSSKYQFLTNGRENVGIKKLKNPKAFIDYSKTIDNVYENLEDYNPTKKRRVLIVFDDMIGDMEFNTDFFSLLSFCRWIVFKRTKTQYFTCFYIKTLF